MFVFTSHLGFVGATVDGVASLLRTLSGVPRPVLELMAKAVLKEYFLRAGKPEFSQLLGSQTVLFDTTTRPAAEVSFERAVKRLLRQAREQHSRVIEFSPDAYASLREQCLASLTFGSRSVVGAVESAFGRPLARELDTTSESAELLVDGFAGGIVRFRSTPPRPDAEHRALERLPRPLATRFAVIRTLGESLDATRYLARDIETDQLYVISLYRAGYVPDPHIQKFSIRQSHHRIVGVSEAGAVAGRAYDVTEYLAGGSLLSAMPQHPSGFDTPTLADIVKQCADGLAHLHAYDVVHGDVKPSNILLRTTEPIDLALAGLETSTYAPDHFTFRLDQAGTTSYLPPEYIGAGLVSPAQDWWALGMTIAELATGRRPLDGLPDDMLRVSIMTLPVSLQGIHDHRVKQLCQGLLDQNHDRRWNAMRVRAWLAGDNPASPS